MDKILELSEGADYSRAIDFFIDGSAPQEDLRPEMLD